MKRIGITIDIENQYYIELEDGTRHSIPFTKIGLRVDNNGDSHYAGLLIDTPDLDERAAFEAVYQPISAILSDKTSKHYTIQGD